MIQNFLSRFMNLFASHKNTLSPLFEESSSIMLLIDPNAGEIINANQAAARYYGVALENLIGSSINTINTLSPEEVKEERQRALKEERNYFNFKHRLHSGEIRDVEVYSTPIKLLDKTFLFSIIHDITDRKKAEAQLIQVNENLIKHEILFKQILDTSSVAIFLVDLEGHITQANQRMAEMFLMSLEELTHGKEYVDLIHPSEREIARQKMAALLNSTISTVDLERIYCRADGKSFWGRLTGNRFYDNKGKEIGLVGVIADIDEQKYVQQCEKNHQKILQMITLKSPLSTILHTMITDTESIHDNRIKSSVLLFDETNNKLTLNTASDELHSISAKLIQTTQSDSSFLDHLMHLDPQPCRVKTLQEKSWWNKKTTPDLTDCWIMPILSTSKKPLGLLMIHALNLAEREIKFVENEVQFIAIAIEKSKNDAKLQLAANVFTYASEGILITDAQGIIIEVNEAFSHTSGYSKEELIGQNPSLLKSERQEKDFYKQLWHDIHSKGHWKGEIWNRRKDGNIYAEMVTINAIKDSEDEIQYFVALYTDITTIKEHEKQLEHLANHDALTSLPNRTLLWDRLKQAIAQTERYQNYLAVVYIDLDGFKEVNDTYGHHIGDELLIIVANRIATLLRKSETIARLGGDEFVAVLKDLGTTKECEPIIQRILESIKEPVVIQEISIHVSASIGVSFYPNNVDEEELLRQADKAMYIAKKMGKNCYHIFDQHDA